MSCKSHSFINSILQVELPARTCCARPEVGINAIVLLSAPELDRDALIYLATLLVVRQGGVDVPLERQCVACSPEHHTIQLKIFAHPNGMRETTITVDIQNGTQPCTVRVIPYSRSGDGVKALIRLIPKEKLSFTKEEVIAYVLHLDEFTKDRNATGTVFERLWAQLLNTDTCSHGQLKKLLGELHAGLKERKKAQRKNQPAPNRRTSNTKAKAIRVPRIKKPSKKEAMRESKEYLRQKVIIMRAENEVLKDENAALAAMNAELRQTLIFFAPFLMNYPLAAASYTAPMDTSDSASTVPPSSSSFSLGSQQPPSSSGNSSCMAACRNDVWVGSFQYTGARGSGEGVSVPNERGAPASWSDDAAAEPPSMDDDFFPPVQERCSAPMDGEDGWETVAFTSIDDDFINPLAASLGDCEESEGGNAKRRRYSTPASEKGKEIEVGSDD